MSSLCSNQSNAVILGFLILRTEPVSLEHDKVRCAFLCLTNFRSVKKEGLEFTFYLCHKLKVARKYLKTSFQKNV